MQGKKQRKEKMRKSKRKGVADLLKLTLLKPHQLQLQFYDFGIFILILQKMGETCSACDMKNKKTDEILSDPHTILSNKNVDINLKENINHEEKIMNQTIRENENDKISKIGTVVSRIGQSKYGYNYKKLDNGGVLLDEIPDFMSEVTKNKKEELGQFIYSKSQFEDEDAQEKEPFLFDNRYVYKGQWKNNERNGRGIQIWKDGSIYEGYWKNNLANGFGRLIHTDGDVYIGQWKFDRANGKGKYLSNYGAEYYGDWKDDKQDGFGQQKWQDGAFYKGQYVGGKKQGKGIFIWGDDSSYQGQFHQNNIHGKGKYCWKDGRVYEGDWLNNKMHGRGIFIWPDGRRYQGQYDNDKKHGYGIFTFKDGRVYQGGWQNGKQHGKGIYRKKKTVREGIWENGIRIKWTQNKQNEVEISRIGEGTQ